MIAHHHDPYVNVVPVWFEWTGDAIEFFTQPSRPKVERLRHDPRLSVLVSAEVSEPVYWVRVEGRAELHGDAAELVERLTDRYLARQSTDVSVLREQLLDSASDAIRVRVVPDRIWHFVR